MPNITVQTTQSPITVTTNRISVTASTTGIQGVPGPQGPAGLNGAVYIQDMLDAIIINPQNDQFLKYINGAWTNVNTQVIDGGNW